MNQRKKKENVCVYTLTGGINKEEAAQYILSLLFIHQRRSQRDQSTRRAKGILFRTEFLYHLEFSISVPFKKSLTSAISFPHLHTQSYTHAQDGGEAVVESNTEMGVELANL